MTGPTWRSNHYVVFQCVFHVAWSRKCGRSVHVPRVGERLTAITVELIQERAALHHGLEGILDYVCLLLEVDPQFGVHRLVKALKGRSSRALRQEFLHLRHRLPTLWTNSYLVATTGGAPLATIEPYVENQKNV